MWNDYVSGYFKKNRTSALSILAAAFISALFLSLLCSLCYNFWLDSIEGTKLEDGDWHGRITGTLQEADLEKIRCFANVERAVVNTELSQGAETVVDVYFFNKRTVYRDMNGLLFALGLTEDAADYNYQLLSLYFIRIPGDEMPRLLLPAYLSIVMLVCISLVMVIHNSFAVSMNSRIHQFGIFSSIGAAPGQIRLCLLQEALFLSVLPILAGMLLGTALSCGIVHAMSNFAADLAGGRQTPFAWHPGILAVVLGLSVLTVLVSAWIPAVKLSRLTPLEAIRGTGTPNPKRKSRMPFHIVSAVFGIEGELVVNAMRAQKKALRTTSLSLVLAFLGFMLMQCFFTLAIISTNHTYFEAYQDVWDVMVTVADTQIGQFEPIQQIQELEGIESGVVYQMAEAEEVISADQISPELLALGGPEHVAGDAVTAREQEFLVKAPIVILDDASFEAYYKEIGAETSQSGNKGVILINRIWDSQNSNFRYKEYIPWLTENRDSILMQSEVWDQNQVELPILAYTQKLPVLREEYANYALVNVMPLSLWRTISGQIGGCQSDMYIRLLADKGAGLEELQTLEEQAAQIAGAAYETESENRLQEKQTNEEMIKGYQVALGGFCILLAIIGIAHLFSHTLGFLRQRKQEFACYQSVGVTPDGIRRMFGIEALLTVGRPVFISLLLTAAAVAVMIKVSYLDPMEFLLEAPIVPIALFVLAVFGFAALAYYLGGRKLQSCTLAEALRDTTKQ